MICPEPSALQELVQDLHRQAQPWLPAGSGSRLSWGSPVEVPLVVSTNQLNKLVEHCAGDFTVTVQAGLPLQTLQAELASAGQWLAIDWPWGSGPAGEASGTVGGLVARGLAGGLRQRYLGVRDQLIGLQVLRADGTWAKAGGKVVKNVAGYDLMRLFSGSWGSLGLITELTLRTYPLPHERSGLLLSGPLGALELLRRRCLTAPLMPQRLDWWSSALSGNNQPALLLALASVSAAAIDDQLRQHEHAAAAAGVATERLDPQQLLELEARSRHGCSDWLLRLGVLPAQASALLNDPALRDLPCCLAAGAGLGMAWASADVLPAYRVTQLRQRCQALGGQLSVLQQPAGLNPPLAAWEESPASRMIEAVKREFDPLQQLARGRLPGAPQPGITA
ncbi:MAG: FAD-binding oxidoreductase [Cyanobacteria bacterium M_surface_10_m2_179]|nr:FAD-binding oxidoreductase [Cyanobacteria bacterium M_surface_10_m2_179]